VPGSKNELLAFDNAGTLKARIPLGAKIPFCVSVDPRSGAAWVTILRRSVQRYSKDGKLEVEHELNALAAQTDPAGGDVWVVTPEETLRLSQKGEVLRRAKHKGTTSQAWIAAY
jgi:hypothetical protein